MDAAALHSLKFRDLFAYSNITIRVRCCCLVSPYDLPPSTDSPAGGGGEGSEDTGGGHAQRIARLSRVGSLSGGPALGLGLGGATALGKLRRPSLPQDLPSSALVLQQCRAQDAELLFETNLDDFEDGMGLLRGLHSGEHPIRVTCCDGVSYADDVCY